jgi:MshEN domain
MATLSSSIVKNHVASMREVEEALARQVIYGGDLVTNLLELAPVSEPELTRLLAESHALEPAPRGELPRAGDAVLGLVPSELALRHSFYPLEEKDGTLMIAVSDPLPAEVEGDLGFSLGVSIVQTAAPLVRIRQAIARDYDLLLDRRMLRLVAKLEGRPDPSPSSMPAPLRDNAMGFPKLPRPASVPPIGYPTPTTLVSHATPPPEPPKSERLPPPSSLPAIPPPATGAATVSTLITPRHPSERVEPASSAPPSWLEPAIPRERGRKRHRGPYTAAMAEHDLFEADSRDDVIGAFFDFASQYFEYSALFALQGDLAEGRDAHGPGADPERIRAIGIPLDLPSVLSSAKNARTFRLLTLASDGLDASLSKDIEREPGRVVLILPIILRGRCVLLLYGDHGQNDVVLDEVGDVIAFSPLINAALERVIMKRKLSARREVAAEVGTAMPLPLSEIQKRRRHRLPAIEQRVEALARAIDATSTSGEHSRVPSTGEESPQAKTPPPSAGPPETAAASPAALAPPPTRDDSPQAKTRVSPVVAVGRSDAAAEDQPFPLTRRTPSGRVVPIVAPPPSSDNPEAVDAGWDAEAQPETHGAATTKPDGQKRRSTQPFEREAELRSDVGHEAPLAPSSRQLAVGPSPPFRRQDAKDRLLPSVIVDVDADCKSLVLRLLEGDEWAADRLVQIGDPAVSVLVAQFPGPIQPDRYRRFADPGSQASECGPVLHTIARMGVVAVPFLVVRTADRDAVVRRWATWLLGEMPNADSARAVARRFSDSDADVRRAALAAGRMMQSDVESRTALRDGLATLAAEPSQALEVRHGSIEAMANLRDPRGVPRLIPLLKTEDGPIVRSVHWALSTLARQDFGTDPKAWYSWWQEHSDRHRVEWLIDALMHASIEIRRAAGDELKALTKEYFGYYEDLPSAERERAQLAYREWWESKGKAEFA